MGEKRRLKIAQRQLMLAQIARREARYALANAIFEEERSGKIHDRARDLLREYERRITQSDTATQSATLRSNLAFVRSLQTMAEDAGKAHKDARDQALWQVQALAKAETRLDAHETRLGEEKRALGTLKEKREIPPELTGSGGMARKLQIQEHTGEEAHRKRRS